MPADRADWTAVKDKIDGYREELIDVQRTLIAIPAVGPFSDGPGEMAKAKAMEDYYRALGLEIIRVDAPDDRVEGGLRPNVVALGGGQESRRVWLLGHLDIVPPGELELWQTDPYELVVEGDKLIGRGSEDNHQGLVSAYLAAKAFVDSGIVPNLGIGLMAVADEETGSAFGLEYVLNTRPDLFSPDDLIVVPDAGNDTGTLIEVAEKSMCWLKFTVNGLQVHASQPAKGRNTLAGSAHMIVALEELNSLFPAEDPLFEPPNSTFPATKKEANVPNVNTVPGEDVFYIDCRILPQYPVDDVMAAVTEIVERVAGERELTVKVEQVNRADAAPPTKADSPVVKAIQAGVKEVYGRQAEPGGIGGGTVAAFFRRAGLPSAVWQTSPGVAHQPNEYSLISDTLSDAKVMAYLMLFG